MTQTKSLLEEPEEDLSIIPSPKPRPTQKPKTKPTGSVENQNLSFSPKYQLPQPPLPLHSLTKIDSRFIPPPHPIKDLINLSTSPVNSIEGKRK